MMSRFTLFTLLLTLSSYALEIIQKPIIFNEKRIALTKEYIQKHYNLTVDDITITPKIIVIHHTGRNSLERSFKRFYNETLHIDRVFIAKSGLLNVSAHYMVDKDGTIYQLMPDNYMARHVIGLNYSSIGIENVGAQDHEDNLTQAQLNANIDLIQYLQKKYPTLKYVIAHYEYQEFENHKLWLEVDNKYRTKKFDPSPRFMKELRKYIPKVLSTHD